MPFGSLWLAVVVASVAVFVASSIIHMVFHHHKSDHKPFPDEAGVAAELRKQKLAPGQYFIPHCSDMAQMKDPAFVKKFAEGPVGVFTVMRSGPPAMGKYLLLWFGFCVLVSFITAYVARHTLKFGQDGMTVFQITGAVAFASYGMTSLQEWIWKALPTSNMMRFLLDGVIYALVTGASFMLLWPAA